MSGDSKSASEWAARYFPLTGDRWLDDDLHITVNRVKDGRVYYQAMTAGDARWASSVPAPLPTGWVLVGRGAAVSQVCAHCHVEATDPGQVLCWICMAEHAAEWADLSQDEARAKTLTLMNETEN
jgi:hypothetical protein